MIPVRKLHRMINPRKISSSNAKYMTAHFIKSKSKKFETPVWLVRRRPQTVKIVEETPKREIFQNIAPEEWDMVKNYA